MSHTEQLKHAHDWLQSRRKLVNLRAVDEMTGMPVGSTSRFLNGKGLPVKHLYDLQRTLVFIGYEPPTPDYRFI